MEKSATTSKNVFQKIKSISDKKSDISSLMFGKLPPQARDLEEAVLGALMIDKHSIGDVVDL